MAGFDFSQADALHPGYLFGYDEITANVTVSSTTEASGTTVIACAAHWFDGNPVWVEFSTPAISAPGFVIVSLFEGSTQIAEFFDFNNTGGVCAAGKFRMGGGAIAAPTRGFHTYTVTAFRAAGGGSAIVYAGTGGAGATFTNPCPAFVSFIKA